MGKTRSQIFLLGILLLGLFLRILFIGQQSFWHDEVVQVRTASLPAVSIVKNDYTYEILPPVSFLALHGWMKLGGCSEVWVRLLFALVGLLTLPAIFLAGRDLFGQTVGLLASLLLAVNPYHVWYSQEARPYIFMVCFCAWHVWFFIKAWKNGGRYWAGFGLFALMGLYSHPFAVITLGVQFLTALLGNRDKKFWRSYVGILILVGIFYLPYLIYFISTMTSRSGAIGNPKELSPLMLGYNIFAWLFGFSVGPSLADLHRNAYLGGFLKTLPYVLPVFVVVGMAMGLQLFQSVRLLVEIKARKTMGLFLWCFSIPVSLYLFAVVSAGTFNPRYTSEALIPFLLLLSLSLCSISVRFIFRICIAVLLLASCFSLARYYFISDYWKEDVRGAARYLNVHANTSRDLILVGDAYAFTYYYEGAGEVLTWSGSSDFSDLDPQVWDNFCEYEIRGEEKLLRAGPWYWNNYDRVWLVYFREWMFDKHHNLEAVLKKHFECVEHAPFPNAQVYGFSISR